MRQAKIFCKPTDSYIKVATYVPVLAIGDVQANGATAVEALKKASEAGADLVVLPELSLTGYSLGDLFFNNSLNSIVHKEITKIAGFGKDIATVLIIGAPLTWRGKLYNCAIVVKDGSIRGVVPKSYLPNYSEFYEMRWFASGKNLKDQSITMGNESVAFGVDLIFQLGSVSFGIEICEDIWAPVPPSTNLVLSGADFICNLSASNELVGKASYRRSIVLAHSSKLACGYIYVSAGVMESTADMVMGGDAFIAENGRIIAEGKGFSRQGELVVTDLDIEHIRHDRAQNMTIQNDPNKVRYINIGKRQNKVTEFSRQVDPWPFVPRDPHRLNENIESIFNIQSQGLATRMATSKMTKLVLGLSGGLDSTLAALVAIRALKVLNLPSTNLNTITMPGYASSKRTQTNADKLAAALSTSHSRIPIIETTDAMLKCLGHNNQPDICYENAQARNRTAILLNRANQDRALVVGTGDLSEIALGWCTFNGDHISHYGVNASIPKTLVKYMIEWVAKQPDFKMAKATLEDILDTPISPELVSTNKNALTQKTEDIIGPYELHDFFLYHFRRWGDDAPKIGYLATIAFANKYSHQEVDKWLNLFFDRFYANQWKRNVMPDGPKVGTVSLSPRGDLRMPPEAVRIESE